VKRILILSASHLCRNPRAVKEASALGAAGYDVTVLTISWQPLHEALDRELIKGLPFRRVTLDFTDRQPAARLLALGRRAGTRIARTLVRRLGWETPAALGPARALLRQARAIPADLVIAHTELPLWIASRLLADGQRVGVDLEDWHSEDLLPHDRKFRPARLLRRVESDVLRSAACAFTTSEALADALVEAYACPRPVVIRNVFPLQSVCRTSRPPAQGPVNFVWFSQTIGPGRGLEDFLGLWKRTSVPSAVHLVGESRDGYFQKLTEPLDPAERQRIHQHPAVSPGELSRRLTDFDIGLALEPKQPRNKNLTISNKLFQYLNAGLAIVATDTAGQSEIVNRVPAIGLFLPESGHHTSVKELDTFLMDPARIRAAQMAARAAAEREYCWEKEQPRLLEAVARALAR